MLKSKAKKKNKKAYCSSIVTTASLSLIFFTTNADKKSCNVFYWQLLQVCLALALERSKGLLFATVYDNKK